MTEPNSKDFLDAAFWEAQGIKPITVNFDDEESIQAGASEIMDRIGEFLLQQPLKENPQSDSTDTPPK
jgi:hypothetical protein